MKIMFRLSLFLLLIILFSSSLMARSGVNSKATKRLDLLRYHSIGNIQMRVSNYGFFGSGDDARPQWPSLEYPSGSGIDYLYQGALWFGAKKVRRDLLGNIYYWLANKDSRIHENDCISNFSLNMQASVPSFLSSVLESYNGDTSSIRFSITYQLKGTPTIGPAGGGHWAIDNIYILSPTTSGDIVAKEFNFDTPTFLTSDSLAVRWETIDNLPAGVEWEFSSNLGTNGTGCVHINKDEINALSGESWESRLVSPPIDLNIYPEAMFIMDYAYNFLGTPIKIEMTNNYQGISGDTQWDDITPGEMWLMTADKRRAVLDTLVTVGFEGGADLFEFLPAYNALEIEHLDNQYTEFNLVDEVLLSSIRTNRRGVDDDGDGLIDEDPAGFGFPMRSNEGLPREFQDLGIGGIYLAQQPANFSEIIQKPELFDKWFPLGFVDLSVEDPAGDFVFSLPYDDDGDGLVDEDGYPVSEQDFISYYYDYSPFGNTRERDWGNGRNDSQHIPLNVRVRQMSYQWSFGYIKNLVYIEFDITNMNTTFMDTLYDCAMGIYMDADVGPQYMLPTERASDDLSYYVPGDGFEFAYTWDKDNDGALHSGYIGARVCSPDPDDIKFACWTWSLPDGPDDSTPRSLAKIISQKTANQKYHLLTNRNPAPAKFTDLRDVDNYDPEVDEDEDGTDTRFLFGFFGAPIGYEHPERDSVWNLAPGATMKIVVAVFPGETVEELKATAEWAKIIYGKAQTLTDVVIPDIEPHYQPPEPPENPAMHLETSETGDRLEVYWDNRSEFAVDYMTVSVGASGWRTDDSTLDSHEDNYDLIPAEVDSLHPEFRVIDDENNVYYNINPNAQVNPWTAYRLRHDFQGYKLWGRSNSSEATMWEEKGIWDKIETEQDYLDYEVARPVFNVDYGGYLGIDSGVPQRRRVAATTDILDEYYQYDKYYDFQKIADLKAENPDLQVFGMPLYKHDYAYDSAVADNYSELSFDDQALLFKRDDVDEELYLAIYNDKYIPLSGHAGQASIDNEKLCEINRKYRLAARYYHSTIVYPPKGVEYYVAVNCFDRGMPSRDLLFLESGRDENMKVIFPGPTSTSNMDDIYVVPNPYIGLSRFDGRIENDLTGDKSRRIWFVNLPERCSVQIYSLAGDLIDELQHNGSEERPILKAGDGSAITASGIEAWDMLSRYNQIIASGVYLFSVKNYENGDIKTGKFVIIK